MPNEYPTISNGKLLKKQIINKLKNLSQALSTLTKD